MTILALFIAVLALVIATGTAWFCVRALDATSKRIDALRDSLDRRIGSVETSVDSRIAATHDRIAHATALAQTHEAAVRSIESFIARQKKPPAKKRSK